MTAAKRKLLNARVIAPRGPSLDGGGICLAHRLRTDAPVRPNAGADIPEEPPPSPKLPPAELLPVLPPIWLPLDWPTTSLPPLAPVFELHPAINNTPATSAKISFIGFRLDHFYH